MKSVRFRPAVEAIEDRLTPAGTPTDVFTAVARAEPNAALVFTLSDLPTDTNLRLNPDLVKAVNDLVFQSDTDATELTSFRTNIGVQVQNNPTLFTTAGVDPGFVTEEAGKYLTRAQLNAALGRSLAARLNITITPPTTPPATPTTPPTTPPTTDPTSPPTTPTTPPTTPPTTSTTDDSGLTGTLPNLSDPGFMDIGSGIRVRDVTLGSGGTGPQAQNGSTVQVFYTGFLASDGKVFDSRRSPATPAQFTLASGSVIEGFRQGLIGLRAGGVRQIFIPAAQGYGATGFPPNIPPNADLVFEVKLVGVS